MAFASDRTGGGREAGARAHGSGEVFPGLEAFIGVGVLVGLISAVVVAGLQGRSDGHLLTLVGQGVGLGGILGLFVGLGRGVGRPGPAIRVREPEPASVRERPVEPVPAPELWDPWLDHGRDLDPTGPEVAIEEPIRAEEPEGPIPLRAAVRPRVVSPQTGEAIPLEDEIGAMLQQDRGGLVVIVGGPGSGKTTALRHMAAILPPWSRGRVRLLEELDLNAIASAGPDPFVILIADLSWIKGIDHAVNMLRATLHPPGARRDPYRLALWTQDDAIEYLLATDRGACVSVMGRLKGAGDFSFLDGIPELCAVVLDRMARDESIGDVRAALRRELADRVERTPVRTEQLQDQCLLEFRNAADARSADVVMELIAIDATNEPLTRLIRHRPAALLLAADRMAAIIEDGRPEPTLAGAFPRELVLEVGRLIAGNAAAVRHLNEWIEGGWSTIQPLAASLLHAAAPGWRPEPGQRPRLAGAYLDAVVWPGQDLAGVNLRRAELRAADLCGANLEKADANEACLAGADLRRAILSHWIANQADLGGANLSDVQARGARFREANLSGAHFIEADLREADLTGARIADAEFIGANLDGAGLSGLPLRQARFEGTRFRGADLRKCDMEGMALTGPDFRDAQLNDALLTGSRMPAANFLDADLRGARLAEVEWPGARLVGADLRGVNFHLGTTRSGLVGSPIACEGSRTGFYTDDDLDRHVRPAEEIRKANLRGADLRGARIGHVDFYLVDLRGARYTADQATHLRRCRAILDDREP